jgi:hypothetical protein
MCDMIHLPPGPLRAANRCHRHGTGPARCGPRGQLSATAQEDLPPIGSEQATHFLIPGRALHPAGQGSAPSLGLQGQGAAAMSLLDCPQVAPAFHCGCTPSSTRQQDAPGSGMSSMWAKPCRAATHWVVTSSTVASGAGGRTPPGGGDGAQDELRVAVTPAGVVDEQPPRCKMGHSRGLLSVRPRVAVCSAPSGAA